MAFVWSRLALAAVLAAGAACAPAEACPEQAARSACSQNECDGPRLVCSDARFVLFGDGLDDAVGSDESSVAGMPRIAIVVGDEDGYEPPALRGDVLVVAPKTSPPQT
jgi:hypothetical protein